MLRENFSSYYFKGNEMEYNGKIKKAVTNRPFDHIKEMNVNRDKTLHTIQLCEVNPRSRNPAERTMSFHNQSAEERVQFAGKHVKQSDKCHSRNSVLN